MASQDNTPVLRGAVLGLGMIGRHHARLLQSSPRVAFSCVARAFKMSAEQRIKMSH